MERNWKLILLILGILLILNVLVWIQALSDKGVSEAVYFIDVGQGDSSLIVFESGEKVLIDGGRDGRVLLEELDKVLNDSDRYIDLVILSHGHFDHYGGLIELMKNYEIGAFLSSGRIGEAEAYGQLQTEIERRKIKFLNLAEGDSLQFSGANIEVLSPSAREILSEDVNLASLVLLLDLQPGNVIFTGDIDKNVEKRLIKDYEVLDVDVLKVAHQGSKYSSDINFLAQVSPALSVIMVGPNTYGHPHKETLDNLSPISEVVRTDEKGTMKLEAQNGEFMLYSVK
ncbi:MAG: hypothetical protein COU09_02180 [Candidatus Harrisonbacteria bacterium CG10_big_fil_rev_8_21_14_0_10_44_23]|uniref:Metallo-beta-lactamase domain-containing protein n=1 Tax=Candidatus Harrisonbacteria bacterium CG10_big_fil_rev_8_21_14_0_10_44_23 TaxID=1974585 RepID=A0A2H0UPV0_9BACT|nr:MAG: hypothetical protein COU09_02180 [Candidatus Harrisonbacteria bacterium CG10_big_fil_rev_8_21_14_0_10_44_23]